MAAMVKMADSLPSRIAKSVADKFSKFRGNTAVPDSRVVKKTPVKSKKGAKAEESEGSILPEAISRRIDASKKWAFDKLPKPVQDKLKAAKAFSKKHDIGPMDVIGGGFMGYMAGNDLANGESIGSVAGQLAGFGVGGKVARKFLPKGEGVGATAVRGVGDMVGSMVGASVLQSAGDKFVPIGRLAKPMEDAYGTAPAITKGAEENSMNKFAMIKEAEVAGVLAAFTDAGLMQKFASDDFDYLTEKVAENLGDNYTVDDVAYVADALLSGGVEKTAEEDFIETAAPIFGYAYMAKLAGEMDDDDLDEFTAGFFEGAGF